MIRFFCDFYEEFIFFKSYPNGRADWDVTVLPMCSSRLYLIEMHAFVCGSSGAGREAAREGAWRQRGGIYQQFERGHACGQDP